MAFHITQNDTLPVFEVEIVDTSRDPRSLVGASARFHMWDKRTRQVKVDRPATITNPTTRRVVYAWQQGDTDVFGDYEAEVEITYSDGAIRTFPTREKTEIIIHPEIS